MTPSTDHDDPAKSGGNSPADHPSRTSALPPDPSGRADTDDHDADSLAILLLFDPTAATDWTAAHPAIRATLLVDAIGQTGVPSALARLPRALAAMPFDSWTAMDPDADQTLLAIVTADPDRPVDWARAVDITAAVARAHGTAARDAATILSRHAPQVPTIHDSRKQMLARIAEDLHTHGTYR